MRLVPAEPATLRIFRAKDGRFGFEGDSVLSRLNGIELDPATRTVHTPVGSCAGYEPISVSPTAPVGAWVGFNCRHEEEPTDSGRAVLIAFSIGRRAEEQDALLTYRMKTVQGWQVTERADIFVTFPLP
jgi:hypothetical protein